MLCFLLLVSSVVELSLAIYDAFTNDFIYPVKYATPLIRACTYVSLLLHSTESIHKILIYFDCFGSSAHNKLIALFLFTTSVSCTCPHTRTPQKGHPHVGQSIFVLDTTVDLCNPQLPADLRLLLVGQR